MEKQREIAATLQNGKVGNLRISSKALEFDLFVDSNDDLHAAEKILSKSSKILTVKRLDIPPTVPGKMKTIKEARNLFNEERFWESHEILEGLWHTLKGEEKNLVQGIILVCAALVHFQKDENDTAISMLKRYQSKLRWHDRFYEGIDLDHLRKGLSKMISEGKRKTFQI
ncbi:MAG: DUF309 domain-containing protein [Thaumarchaeota archaeon]|nr:DUF309 domain-containing protein [Nitrososphaerota archaeon]